MSVIADAYLAGVSTRRVEKLGVERMSKSQVSRLAKRLDALVEDFRTRPLDGAPYPYLVLDALEVKYREGGRTVNACVVHAAAVNREGYRESLGLDVVTSEDGAAWLAFLRWLVARGLSGIELVTFGRAPRPRRTRISSLLSEWAAGEFRATAPEKPSDCLDNRCDPRGLCPVQKSPGSEVSLMCVHRGASNDQARRS